MSFQQLYYTSCEQGLTGYAGYQFNAVTDGTSGETMRAVESLTAYEPPRSTAYASAPDELARCPVNLCFSPGKTTILANVRYVGRDSSRRFGNYFAHALATSDLDADDAVLLPIELWRASWWDCRPAPTTSLPALRGPLRAGPLSRDQVTEFLDGHPHRGKLAALVSAAGLARSRGDRSVLVVADTADEVASWFAAVSYLLPPRWVRGLSFSTYLNRPSRSRLHMLGTVRETDLDLGVDAEEKFYLFDFPGGRFADVPENALASLCVGIGLRELPALWSWADSLASGHETSLDDWYPVTAAAAALGRVAITGADLDAVTAWLKASASLPTGTQNAIARALHGNPGLTMDHRRVLREVSERTGDTGLWEQAHYELLEAQLLVRQDGPAVAAALRPTAEFTQAAGRVRDQLTSRAEEQLRLAVDAGDALSLLDWAALAGLEIAPDVLAESGRTLIGPLLATDRHGRPLPQPQRDQAARVTRARAVREGLVRYLDALATRQPGDVAHAMAGITGELLSEEDIGPNPPVRVPYLVYRKLRERRRPVDILRGLTESGDVRDADGMLLSMLWPTGNWSIPEAIQVADAVNPGVLSGALGWFEAALARKPMPAERGKYAALCAKLVTSPLAGALAAPERPALREVCDLHAACSRARQLRDLLPVIGAMHGRESAPALELSAEWLAPKVAGLPASADELVTALTRMHATGVSRYLRLTRERFTGARAGNPAHAAALWLWAMGGAGRPYAEPIGEMLGYAARIWPPEQLQQAVNLVRGLDRAAGEAFGDWIGHQRPNQFRGIATVVHKVGGALRKIAFGRPMEG